MSTNLNESMKGSPLQECLTDLQDKIAQVEDRVETLRRRLDYVLIPTPELSSETVAVEDARSPASASVCSLRTAIDRLNSLRWRIESTIDRLEV